MPWVPAPPRATRRWTGFGATHVHWPTTTPAYINRASSVTTWSTMNCRRRSGGWVSPKRQMARPIGLRHDTELADDLHPDVQQASGGVTDTGEGRAGQIDNPATDKGSPVIDAHHHTLAVAHIGHPDLRAEGQRPVCCSVPADLVKLAAGGLPVLETVGVERRLSCLRMSDPVAAMARPIDAAAAGHRGQDHEQDQRPDS